MLTEHPPTPGLSIKGLLTTEEAAAILGISAKTLHTDRTARRRLKVPFVKLGASVRYQPAALQAWIEAHAREG